MRTTIRPAEGLFARWKLFADEAPAQGISVCESDTGEFGTREIVRRSEWDVGKIYWSFSISPDARTVASSSRDSFLRLLDLESGWKRITCLSDRHFLAVVWHPTPSHPRAGPPLLGDRQS